MQRVLIGLSRLMMLVRVVRFLVQATSDRQVNSMGVFAGSNFNKQIQLNGQIVHRWGHFDFDFGNGDKYPRVSPAALALAELAQANALNQCDEEDRKAALPYATPKLLSIRVAETCFRSQQELPISQPTLCARHSISITRV